MNGQKPMAVLLGIGLGLALCGGGFGALAYWHESYVDGLEVCIRCAAERDVERRGPFAWTSAPRAGSTEVLGACAVHHWTSTGCWRIDGGFAKLATPRVLARTVADVLRGEHEASIPYLRRLIESIPDEAPALRTEARAWLAYALNESGDPEGCLAELALALAEDPRDPWLHYEQGRAWTTIGEYQRAIAGYRRAIELDPGFARAWQWLGHCLRLLERPAEALAADTRALELAEQADAASLRYWRAERRELLLEILAERMHCLTALGDHDGALRDRIRSEELQLER
jgi:hypothetical protein